MTRTKNVCRSKVTGLPRALFPEKIASTEGQRAPEKDNRHPKGNIALKPSPAPRKDLEKVYRRTQIEKQFRASWLSVNERSLRGGVNFRGRAAPIPEGEIEVMTNVALGSARRKGGKKIKFEKLARAALVAGAASFQKALMDRSVQIAGEDDPLYPGEAPFLWKGHERGVRLEDLSSESDGSDTE